MVRRRFTLKAYQKYFCNGMLVVATEHPRITWFYHTFRRLRRKRIICIMVIHEYDEPCKKKVINSNYTEISPQLTSVLINWMFPIQVPFSVSSTISYMEPPQPQSRKSAASSGASSRSKKSLIVKEEENKSNEEYLHIDNFDFKVGRWGITWFY